MTKYLSCAETAKLVRQALKESFPGVKFSVRSDVYSGGASIRVRYLDGPALGMVESVAKFFEGAYFDGMIDYKGSRTHKLDGELVHLGANFVFVDRDHSDDAVNLALLEAAKYVGVTLPADPLAAYRSGGAHRVIPGEVSDLFARRFYNRLSKRSDRLAPSSSATLKRLAFYGDDGYGQGTVGKPGGNGGEQAYKAMEEARERARLMPELAGMAPRGNA